MGVEALTFRGRRRGLGRRGPSTRRSCGREGEGGGASEHTETGSRRRACERDRDGGAGWGSCVCLLHPAVAAVEDEAARAAAEGRNQRIGGGLRRRHGWRRRQRRQDSLRVASQRRSRMQFNKRTFEACRPRFVHIPCSFHLVCLFVFHIFLWFVEFLVLCNLLLLSGS